MKSAARNPKSLVKPLHILVVDDDRRMVKTICDILRTKGHRCAQAYSAEQAREKVKGQRYDCMLADIKMPGMNGVELCKSIKVMNPGLPVVLMTAYTSDVLIKEGIEEGAVAVLNKPLDVSLLLDYFSTLRREHSIVVVDDDPNFRRTVGDILWEQGFVVSEVKDPDRFEEKSCREVGTVLLDMKLNGTSGLEILGKIKIRFPGLPVVIVTGYREEMAGAIKTALKMNAYTCLYKPIEVKSLLGVLSEIQLKKMGEVFGRPFVKGTSRGV